MSCIECSGCGGQTNTALCDWVNCIETGKAEKCYARWENEHWVKGCAEDKGFMRDFADKIIRIKKGGKMSEVKERIIELLTDTKRQGIPPLLDYLITEGFFESPASTRFHGSYPGGLAYHSLRVYESLSTFCLKLEPGVAIAPGQKPLPLSPENIIIAGLLHDVFKAGAYIGNEAPYKCNKETPKGHAMLSIKIIKGFIELEPIEELIIRYHMGVWGLFEYYDKGSWEYKTQPEYYLRSQEKKKKGMTPDEKKADQEARYGKSMRNAYFHNPVCFWMHVADMQATAEEKI